MSAGTKSSWATSPEPGPKVQPRRLGLHLRPPGVVPQDPSSPQQVLGQPAALPGTLLPELPRGTDTLPARTLLPARATHHHVILNS